jgi:3',5'-cyclic-AMP phosphodiesterase
MKIAHLSDIHFTTFFRNFDLYKFENLLQYCNARRIDHLIITGDLVENPDEYDFELLRKVLKQNGFLTSDRLSLVIGNHDVFGGVVTVEDLFNFTNNCEQIDYNHRVREFYDYFSESFEYCSYISPVNIFPYAKIINDVLIIGLNSVAEYSKAKNIFASNGEINPVQLNEVTGILNMYSNYKKKLVLIHHHFGESKQIHQNRFGSVWQMIEKQTMKLRTKKQLLELFNNFNVDLVLHGHYHEMSEYYRKGIRFLNAGGSFKNELKEQNLVNFLDLSLPKLKVDVARIPRLLSPKILSFGKLNSVTF